MSQTEPVANEPTDPMTWTPEYARKFNRLDIKALRDAGGDGWDAIDDPEAFLGRDKPGEKYKKPFGSGDCSHDVYDVLVAFGVTCPAVQHAVKKLLCAGQRGHKDRLTDLNEAATAIARAVELATYQTQKVNYVR